MPRVYIIILNYKKWEDTIECLETVFRSRYDDFTVFVIDNDSQNNSLKHLFHWAAHHTVFANRLSQFSKDTLQKPIAYSYFDENEFTSEIKPASLPQLIFIQN